jgi:hypothetical protein
MYAVIGYGFSEVPRREMDGTARKAFPVINSISHFDTRGGAIDDVIKRLGDIVNNADGDVVLSSYGVTDVSYDANDNCLAYSKTVFDEDHPESNLFGLRKCMELYGHSHVEVEVGGTKATYAIVRVKED